MSDNKSIFELKNLRNIYDPLQYLNYSTYLQNQWQPQWETFNFNIKKMSIEKTQLQEEKEEKEKEKEEVKMQEKEEEIKKLKEEIKNIIEQEDEKQKILKITIPDCLDKNITATTVIIYGNVSGDIKAENVVCMEGNINSNNIQTNKIFTKNNLIENEINDIKYNYRKKHPNCKYCKFKELKPNPLYTFIKDDICIIKDKKVDESAGIRAFFCSYYKPKEIKEEENNE